MVSLAHAQGEVKTIKVETHQVWQAKTNQDWCSITVTDTVGSGTAEITIANNTSSSSRIAEITFYTPIASAEDKILTISQEGAVFVTDISLIRKGFSLEISDTAILFYEVAPTNVTYNFNWVSSNPNIATVNDYGKVTAMGVGTTIITASAQYRDVQANCRVSVIKFDVPVDGDGNTYQTTVIGDQVWLAENLKTTKYNDGTSIPLVTDDNEWAALESPGYCWYYNDEATYKELFGGLYNYYAIDKSSNGNKNVCPSGWHVPSNEEWKQMQEYLITSGFNNGKPATENYIAQSLASEKEWKPYGGNGLTNSNNSTGFSALPGGQRNVDDAFKDRNFTGFWWSSTGKSKEYPAYRYLEYDHSSLQIYSGNKKNGYSIRCVMD